MRVMLAVLLLVAGVSFADDPPDEVMNLLDANEIADEPIWKPWPAGGKDLWVVAGVYGGHTDATIVAAVVRKTANGFELVARSEGEEPLTVEPVNVFDLELDLIPYRISDRDVAFGVRFENGYNSTARASFTNALHLYRRDGDRLVPVFEAITYDQDLEKAQTDEEENLEVVVRSVVVVSHRKSKGFYDLIVRQKKPKKSTTYRWNGTRYAPLSR